MKLTIILLLSVLCVFLVAFKPAEGLKCQVCQYTEIHGTGVGDSKCVFGNSKAIEECNHHSGDTKQACKTTETDTELYGVRYKATIRSCGFSDDDKPGCRKTRGGDFSNLPAEFRNLVGSSPEMKECTCFKDYCNSANKFSLSATVLIGLVSLSAILLLFK